MQRQVASYVDFSGGWAPDVDPAAMADNQLQMLTNMLPMPGAYLRSRDGCTKTLTPSVGQTIAAVFEWVPGSGVPLLCTVRKAGSSYSLNFDAYSVPLAGAKVGQASFNDYLYLVDSASFRRVSTAGAISAVEEPNRVKTSAFTASAVSIPTTPTAPGVTVTGTNLGGGSSLYLTAGHTYKAAFVFVNAAGIESQAVEVTFSVPSGDGYTSHTAALTSVPLDGGDSSVTKQRQYLRDVTSGEAYTICHERAKSTTDWPFRNVFTTSDTVITRSPTPSTTGAAAGDFTYNIVGVKDSGEKLLPADGVALTVTSSQCAKLVLPVAQTGVTTYEVYRRRSTDTSGRLAATVTAGASTIDWYDTIPDSALTGALPNLERIARCTMLARHPASGRFFAAGDVADPSSVYYSDPNEPWSWPGEGQLRPTGSEGPVTALATFGDALLVFYARSIWAYRGIDPDTDARWFRLPTNQGCVAPRSICHTTNSITFLGHGGIYSISVSMLDMSVVMEPGQEFMTNMASPLVVSLLNAIGQPEKAAAVYDPERQLFLLAFTADAAPAANDKVLAMYWPARAFALFDGWEPLEWLVRRDGTLVYAGEDGLYTALSGATDNGAPIAWELQTKAINMGAHGIEKKLKRLVLSTRAPTATEVELTVTCDGVADTATLSVAPTAGDAYSDIEHRVRQRGHRFSVGLSGEGSGVNLHGIALEFVPGKLRGTRQ